MKTILCALLLISVNAVAAPDHVQHISRYQVLVDSTGKKFTFNGVSGHPEIGMLVCKSQSVNPASCKYIINRPSTY